MPQSLRVAWMGLAAMAGTLLCSAPRLSAAQAPEASSSSPVAATPAAAPATTPDLPFTHGKLADGAAKSAVCSACHGPNGNSVNPEWPRLAGQSAVYIAEQLRLFRSGVRGNPVMQPLATTLSDQDIDDLAVYTRPKNPRGWRPTLHTGGVGRPFMCPATRPRRAPRASPGTGPWAAGIPAPGSPPC